MCKSQNILGAGNYTFVDDAMPPILGSLSYIAKVLPRIVPKILDAANGVLRLTEVV